MLDGLGQLNSNEISSLVLTEVIKVLTLFETSFFSNTAPKSFTAKIWVEMLLG